MGCEGAFAAGDAVEVASADGARVVGKGISAFSADEVRQVAGLPRPRSARRGCPTRPTRSMHRDQFVLLIGSRLAG